MAEFNSYLLGRGRKSVGNITLYYVRKKNIARAKVFSRKDNPTPAVLEQRAKLKMLGQMGRKLLPVIRKGFAGVGNGTTSNAFVAENMKNVTVDENGLATVDYLNLKMASGILYPPQVTLTYAEGEKNYTFEQMAEEEEEGFAVSSDQVYGVLFETALMRGRLVALKNRGETGSVPVALPEGWDPARVHAYCFATTANGRMASDSVYLVV